MDAIFGRIGFIGSGAMAEGLIRGLIGHGVPAATIWASDISHARLQYMGQTLGCNATTSNQEVLGACATVVLAVKPQVLPELLTAIAPHTPNHLMISIAAGIGISSIESALPAGVPVVRAMPNTPCTIGKGAIAVSASPSCSREHLERAKAILSASGYVVEVGENLMDAVTGLSGSGPAYVFTFIEAMIDGAVKAGLPRDLARGLALETVLGSAELVRQSGLHPAVCRDMVTSPGGTTIAAVAALEENGLRTAVIKAVEAAAQRSRELGANKGGKA